MIIKKVEYIVEKFVENELIEIAERDEYIYSIVCFVEGLITTGSILLIALMNREVIPTIFFLTLFYMLRKRTGGVHFDTFSHCYIGTLILYVTISRFAKYVINTPLALIFLTFCACIFILLIGTINHPNISMNEEELNQSKKSSRLLVAMQTLLILFMCWMGLNREIIVYMCLAIILCATLLIIAKIVKQEVKENG